MQFEMINQERTLTVIHLDHLTGEFVGEGQVLVPPMTGLPAHCTLVKPPREKKNTARVFNVDSQSWDYAEDHRSKTVYDKTTSFAYVVSALGPLPDNFTFTAPEGAFSKWTGAGWVKDEAAALQAAQYEGEQKKNALFQEAARLMAPLQNAVKHYIATENEQQLLAEWEKYTVLLNRVNVNSPDEIVWPAAPQNVA
ncbi:tail fiber assembly protein [Pantoea sp. y20]